MKQEIQQTIQQKAYEIWEASGRPDNEDLNHWFRAERELGTARGKTNRKPPAKKAAGRK